MLGPQAVYNLSEAEERLIEELLSALYDEFQRDSSLEEEFREKGEVEVIVTIDEEYDASKEDVSDVVVQTELRHRLWDWRWTSVHVERISGNRYRFSLSVNPENPDQ